LRLHALDFPEGKGLIHEGLQAPIDESPGGLAFMMREPALVNARDLEGFHSEVVQQLRAEGVRSVCSLPLIAPNRILGTLNLASLRDGNFAQEDAQVLSQVASQIAIALENALAFREIDERKNKLAEEKLCLEDEIRSEYNFDEIIGETAALAKNSEQMTTKEKYMGKLEGKIALITGGNSVVPRDGDSAAAKGPRASRARDRGQRDARQNPRTL
jgi:formate hydrogenlyase transcriptional activator